MLAEMLTRSSDNHDRDLTGNIQYLQMVLVSQWTVECLIYLLTQFNCSNLITSPLISAKTQDVVPILELVNEQIIFKLGQIPRCRVIMDSGSEDILFCNLISKYHLPPSNLILSH